MYCRSVALLEGRVGIGWRSAACTAVARWQGIRTVELHNGQRTYGLVARSRSNKELRCANVLDSAMEEGKNMWSQQTDSVRCPPAVYRRKMAMYAGTSVTARAAQMSFLTSLGDFPSGPLDLLSALVGFRGEFGGSRAARADGTDAWAWSSWSEQLGTQGARLGGGLTPRPWERRTLQSG